MFCTGFCTGVLLNMTKVNESTWGDSVIGDKNAPENFRPGGVGSVCGILELKTDKQAENFGQSVGTVAFLVEFPDGSAIDKPESFCSYR